jgi:hypothetical protein
VLFTTPNAQPRDVIVQLCKVVPPDLQAQAPTALFPVLFHVWECPTPTSTLSALLLGDQHGLHELPPLPCGETLWLEARTCLSANHAASSAEMTEAQLREQRALTHSANEATATDLLGARAADEQLDLALIQSISSREAARALARQRQPPSGVPTSELDESRLARDRDSLQPPQPLPLPPVHGSDTAHGRNHEPSPPRTNHGGKHTWGGLPPFPPPPPLPPRSRRRPSEQPASSSSEKPASDRGGVMQDGRVEGAEEPRGAMTELEWQPQPLSTEVLALPSLGKIDRGESTHSEQMDRCLDCVHVWTVYPLRLASRVPSSSGPLGGARLLRTPSTHNRRPQHPRGVAQ